MANEFIEIRDVPPTWGSEGVVISTVECPPPLTQFEQMVFECLRNARKASSKKDREYALTPLWYWYYEKEKPLKS